MRNRGRKSGAPIGVARSRNPISLRKESTGKRHIKDRGGSNNAKSFLKLEHLQKLAVWASGEASIPSLGASYLWTFRLILLFFIARDVKQFFSRESTAPSE